MRNEEEESYLEDITITFRHSEVEDSPENSNQFTSDRIFEDENEHQTAINIGESFRRRKITRQEDYDFQDEICVNPGIESTNIEIEDVEEIETEGEQSENRIWSSMKSIVSCFYMQKINNRMRYSHRISNDRLPTSISASGDDENYFSRKSVHRRNGEVVRLLSANETIYQKFPDEVFGNHSSEMFFWPYLIPWQVMIMTILLINYEIITYNVFYDFRYMYKYIPIVNSFSQYMIFWVLQMIYTIDSMLTLVHRQWNEFQIKNTITPRNRCFVANDLAVLLPTFLCSYLLDKEKFWVHAVQILSLNRIFLYTRQMTSTLKISRFTILYLGFIFIWLFNIALSSISFGASCFPDAEVDEWVCGKGYFYKSYSNMKYMGKPTTEFELYALTKLHALFLLPPMCEAEYYEDGGPFIKWMYIIFLTAMLLYSYLFVVPLLCKRIFKNDYMWISFSMMRYKAINSLLEMKFADIPSSKVDKFFTYAWRKRRALLVEPVVDDVPPELWLSVHHDIFYPAFAHSQLFVSEDHCFLRGLASRMRSELLMEGDVIVRKKELVARMIYVVEGSVQILTTEDDTTPQMVLGAGTVIGETSLIASYVSKCYICCHSMTCEIHVLDKLDFIEISSIYRKKFHLAMRTVKQRYQNAKLLDRLSVMVKAKVKKSLRLEEQLVTSTDWLKFKMQVNDNNEASLNSEEYSFSGLENWYIHASHTLSYLGLLALPQTGFESVADPVLLKLTFPFIFQPNSRVHQFWNKVIFVAVLFLAIYLPYSFSFSCTYTPFMRFYPIIYLILNTLDILLQISTSVQTKRGMSISIPEILYHLLQKPLFVVDLISTLPLYILSYVALNETALLKPFFQLNQLLKLYRIDQYLEDKWTIQTEYQFYWRRLIKYVVYFAYLLYLTTCLIFGAICANDYKCLNKEVYITREGQEYDDAPIYQLIFLGFYKTSSYFFGTLSLSVMEDVTLHECLPFAVIRVVSYFMNIYLFCSLISIKAFSKEEQFKFNENVKSLLMMTKENSRRTFENFRYSSDFQVYKYAYFLRHEVFQPGMPSSLGLILKSNVFMKVIMEHPIFVEMPRDLVMRLANYFQLMTIPMNQIIIKQYHPPKCMYFIINGVLKAIEDGTVMKKRLKPGDGVGVLEVCFGLPYKRSIVCETDVEVLVLNRNIFKRYLSNNHQGTEAIKHMLLLYQKTINSENKDRADMHQNVMNFLREKSMIFVYSRAFQPSVLHFSITRNIPNMFRGIVKLVRANSTFHPHSEFVYKLEFFHAALAISAFIFYPLQPVLVNCYMPETQVINLVLIGLGALLIYLQSCIGYYDPATGILVTRRGKAVKHYLKHSMCLDIFAIIPFEFLPITERQNIQLLLTYNRLFQIYRFIRGMNYLERKYKNYQVILTFAHFIVLLFLLLNALSSLVLINSCAVGIDINTDDLDKFSSCLKCYEDTLIRSVADSVKWGGKALHISSSEAYMYSAYFAITTIMSNALQNLVAHNSTEVVLSCVGPIFGLFLFLLYTSVFVNTVLDINHAEYQFSMKVEKLLHFYKTLEIPEEITIMTKSYLSSIWNFNRSLNLIDILEPVNSTTKTDIMFHVFIENLLKNKLLFEHAPYIFFDKLFDNIKIRYYSHKCYIILSGDIINEVYLVTKGYVHIFDSQKNYVGTIGPGSIFGAVGPVTWSHQRFSFVATSFVEALVIPALDMHKKVLLHLPELKKFFTEDQRYDMLVDVTDKLSSDSTPHQNNSSFKHSFKSGPKRGKSMRAHSYLSFHSFHDFSTPRIIPGPNNTILKVWTEFFVFLCTFSSSLTIYCIAINDDSVTFYVLYYVIDFFKMCNIFFRQQKINPEAKSNLPIVKNRKLSILFDIFISFPVDSFFILVGADVFLINLLKINRLFALIYVRYHWIVTCKRSMRDILANKISKLIFAVVLLNLASFFLVAISSLLYIIWVDQENYIDDGDNVFKQTHFLKCMAFIVGLHLPYDISTATMFPKTKYMLAFNVIFKLLSPFIFAVFLGYVYVCVCRSRFCYPEFMRRSTTFLRFLQNQRVANRFLFKVKSTFENNWYKFKDSPIPELFSILPYHLQTAVKNHAFGEHINFNIVFYGCNSDFLRQIIGCLKVLWLQPGDKIVKIHSRNGCMFFVVDGIVVMNGSNGVTIEILEPWESFGMAQGIDPNVGHAFNYIAHSNCCIAYLNYKDWSHLGEFHPESMRLIRDRIDEINIKLEEQYGASRYY